MEILQFAFEWISHRFTQAPSQSCLLINLFCIFSTSAFSNAPIVNTLLFRTQDLRVWANWCCNKARFLLQQLRHQRNKQKIYADIHFNFVGGLLNWVIWQLQMNEETTGSGDGPSRSIGTLLGKYVTGLIYRGLWGKGELLGESVHRELVRDSWSRTLETEHVSL